MKIKCAFLPEPLTLGEFAEKHDLTMKVVERDHWQVRTGNKRFYAEFEDVMVKHGFNELSLYGNGETVGEAICDYYDIIQGNSLIIVSKDKVIKCPNNLKLEWRDERVY